MLATVGVEVVVKADIGGGTGSIASLLAAQGYDVVGIDFSAQMLQRGRTKVAGGRLASV